MNKVKGMLGCGFALALAMLAWGCSGTAGNAVPFSPTTGQHPATWIKDHYAEYVKSPAQCRSCHGSTSDPALAGGIAKVSCFTCHPAGINHPTDWANPAQHGRLGAQLAPVPGSATAMAGFAHCAKCHGSNYDNGLTTSCRACHTNAPHPNRPWTGKVVDAPSHVQTATLNAPECAKCHRAGANSTMKPLTTPPAGTAPGCFNETLCHGTNIQR